MAAGSISPTPIDGHDDVPLAESPAYRNYLAAAGFKPGQVRYTVQPPNRPSALAAHRHHAVAAQARGRAGALETDAPRQRDFGPHHSRLAGDVMKTTKTLVGTPDPIDRAAIFAARRAWVRDTLLAHQSWLSSPLRRRSSGSPEPFVPSGSAGPSRPPSTRPPTGPRIARGPVFFCNNYLERVAGLEPA